ncbi:MAG: 4Fe-4S dicluster domain-containing protein [Candidatus Micrarchaeia archaeon]
MIIEPILKVATSTLKKPTTVEFPEHREILTDNYRCIHKLDMNTCINCGACARICPNQTITMVDAEADTAFKPHGTTKQFPEINLERCLFCALCEEVCPTKCLVLTKNTEVEAYDRREYIKRPEELD